MEKKSHNRKNTNMTSQGKNLEKSWKKFNPILYYIIFFRAFSVSILMAVIISI